LVVVASSFDSLKLMQPVEIRVDNLTGLDVIELLQEHLRCMRRVTPPESVHALDLDALRQPGVTFWTAWDGSELAGCAALKEIDREHGEVKSMRTAYAYQRKGIAAQLLQHLMAEAKRRGYRRLSLETGSMDYFEPARNLYRRFGFESCPPFASYVEDPNSVFMTKEL
jgi:putative acetyltransferase